MFPQVQKEIPEYYLAFLALPPSKALPYVTQSSRSLKQLKSILMNSRTVVLLLPVQYLMVTSAFPYSNEPLFYEFQLNPSFHWFLHYLGQEVVTDDLQAPPELLMPGCDVPPADSGVALVPHEDKGL